MNTIPFISRGIPISQVLFESITTIGNSAEDFSLIDSSLPINFTDLENFRFSL